MRFRFWASLVLSVFLPLLVVFGWGIHFIISFQNQNQERSIQDALSKTQTFYTHSITSKMETLESQIQDSIKSKAFPKENFIALGIFNIATKEIIGTETHPDYIADQKSLSVNVAKMLQSQPDYIAPNKFSFDIFQWKKENSENNQIFFIFNKPEFLVEDSKPLKKAEDSKESQVFFGVLNKDFFNFMEANWNDKEDSEIFLADSQGKILFHSNKKYEFKKLSQSSHIKKSIENRHYISNNFINTYKKDEISTISRVQRLNNLNLFLVSKMPWQSTLKASQSWIFTWLVFCLLIMALIFIGLAFTFYPVHSAYNYLRYFFIHFAKTGEILNWDIKIKNPYLNFYKNRSDFLMSKLEDIKKPATPPKEKKHYTLKTLLEEEEKILKQKYPNFHVIDKIDNNISLFHFSDAMRIVLHQILLNAIEAMGGQETQDVFVSGYTKEDSFILKIQDRGVGLFETDYDRVFELYYSSKSQLGVGLNLVQAIVQSQDGFIEFSPVHPRGLEVSIHLPMKCFLKSYAQVPQHMLNKDAFLKNQSPELRS